MHSFKDSKFILRICKVLSKRSQWLNHVLLAPKVLLQSTSVPWAFPTLPTWFALCIWPGGMVSCLCASPSLHMRQSPQPLEHYSLRGDGE